MLERRSREADILLPAGYRICKEYRRIVEGLAVNVGDTMPQLKDGVVKTKR